MRRARRIIDEEIRPFDGRVADERFAVKLTRACADRAAERRAELTRRHR